MKKILLIISIFLTLCACTAKREIIEIPVETVKTEYVNQLCRDSVFIHDSINRYISGDTVYQYKYKYTYKYLNKIDTVIKTDSIQVPVEIRSTEIKEVNKIKWYQSVLMWLGGLFVILLSFKLGKSLKLKIRT